MVKYRRAMIDEAVDKRLRDVCFELEKHYQLKLLEIGTGVDHAHMKIPKKACENPTFNLLTLLN